MRRATCSRGGAEEAQSGSHLRLMDLCVGLLINFGAETLREGVSRIVNNYQGERPSEVR